MNDKDESKTIGELQLSDGDIIKVLEKNERNSTKYDIMLDRYRLTPRAQEASADIFENFAKDSKMDLASTTEFVRVYFSKFFFIIS